MCDHPRHGKEVLCKDDLDCAIRRGRAEVCHPLGAAMKAEKHTESEGPSLLDVVALLAGVPGRSPRPRTALRIHGIEVNISRVAEFEDEWTWTDPPDHGRRMPKLDEQRAQGADWRRQVPLQCAGRMEAACRTGLIRSRC